MKHPLLMMNVFFVGMNISSPMIMQMRGKKKMRLVFVFVLVLVVFLLQANSAHTKHSYTMNKGREREGTKEREEKIPLHSVILVLMCISSLMMVE